MDSSSKARPVCRDMNRGSFAARLLWGAVTSLSLLIALPLTSSALSESFAQTAGALVQISVGADGTAWGINGSQQIYTYNSTKAQWTNVPGALTQIAVGSSTAVWGINAQGEIYTWNSTASAWSNIPGSLKEIAVGADGDVWGLNSSSGSNIYHYSASTGLFGPVGGSLTELAVGSAGAVYGLNVDGSIYWYNPGTGYFQLLANSVGFDQPSSTEPKTIAVGIDGDLWAIKVGVAYHYNVLRDRFDSTGQAMSQIVVGSGAAVFGLDASENIWQWNATAQTWAQLGGNLTSIAAGANGALWGVNSSQEIFQLMNAPTRAYQTLNTISGAVLDQISVGVDGTVWGVSNLTVQWFNPGTQTFQTVTSPPYIAQVSVGARGDVWGVTGCHNPNPTTGACPNPNEPGVIYQYNASAGTWTNIPGELNLVQVSEGPFPNGSVWGINAAGSTYYYDFLSSGWIQIPGNLGTLSVGADGAVWGINSFLQVYRYSGGTNGVVGTWVNIPLPPLSPSSPGSLSEISVGDANNVWGVNAEGQVYYYDNATSAWVTIPGASLDEVWATFDGAVWGVNIDGSLYQWNASTKSFNFVANGVSQVVVGNATNVWTTFVGSTTPVLPATVSAWF